VSNSFCRAEAQRRYSPPPPFRRKSASVGNYPGAASIEDLPPSLTLIHSAGNEGASPAAAAVDGGSDDGEVVQLEALL